MHWIDNIRRQIMGKNIYADYVNNFEVSKTLRFELIPQGKTQDYILERGILAEDYERAEDYKKVKRLLDEYYKYFIENALKNLRLTNLDKYFELYIKFNRNDKEQKELEKLEFDMKKQIVNCFKNDEKFAILFKKEIITSELKEFVDLNEDKEIIDKFKMFTTYFKGFFENRKNIFSDEAKSTAISFRIVHQNLPRYIDNMRAYASFDSSEIKNNLIKLMEDFKLELQGRTIDDFFCVDNYTYVVTNKDIALYNALIGGKTLSDGTKIKGINEYVNLYNQKNNKDKTVKKIPKMKLLYKQILADRETLTFVDEKFNNDQQVIDTINDIVDEIKNNVFSDKAPNSLEKLLQNIKQYDLKKIYITNGNAITEISNSVFGDWSVIKRAIENEYDELNAKKVRNEKYYEARTKAINKIKSFSIEYLDKVVEKYGEYILKVEDYFLTFGNNDEKDLLNNFKKSYEKAQTLLLEPYVSKKGLNNDKKNVALIKALMDSIKDIEKFIKPLMGVGTENVKDDTFYGELDIIYKTINMITPLYNKVRNYVTRKPYSNEKIKINFQNPTFLDGWDKNKEKDNLALLFRKGDLYYLGVMNKKDNKLFSENFPEDKKDYYEKMEYKLIPGPQKMLPKVLFAQSNLSIFKPSNEILEIYKKGSFKLGDNFNIDDCHKLIDFYKQSLDIHKDWSKFNFKFKDTKEYNDISQFYHDMERQAYSVKFTKISSTYIDELVATGKLYLFKIYNKDFSEFSKGTPNLHTIYWKMLFDERNLSDVVFKLNGEAELFFRKASIAQEDAVIHEKNKPIEKKNVKSRVNNEKSLFSYDLIKDKRYTVDKYHLHVPITMNYSSTGRSFFNDAVIETIRDNPNINVIGIDRGERNLLYISVIDCEGKIIEQKSLNIVENDKGYEQNYHKLLDIKEHEMNVARKNWMEIESIKELKEGYLSQAIHLITELMLKYEAIVVLEDLNFGFMNGRKKVGKQVYQKFEKMLIDKLNYLVDKKIDPEMEGGALHAYQLANKFESFSKLGKQSGFLFYIPAWNTSKIDPMTGFVNLLYPKYTNEISAKDFISKFDRIFYNEVEGFFEFSFSYDNFTEKAEGTKNVWTICSYGKRIVSFRNDKKNNEWDWKEIDITEQIKSHLEGQCIDIRQNDLRESICNVNSASFFQEILSDIKLVLQIRNSSKEEDYMISPVKNSSGEFFDTRMYNEANSFLPKDADANGAYNIARKGLLLLERIRNANKGKVQLTITNKEWLNYAQKNCLNKKYE